MTDSSQKFIARNRAPRVQIEYDVELYGSEKKVQLPFVMGVMSDLAGKSLPLLLIGVFFAGLALNLTPCVFPLIPITIGYFTQQTKDREGSTFPLALAYVVGIALTYSALGVLAALSGAIFGSALQSPWVVGLIVAVLLSLATSMFGLWELRVPGLNPHVRDHNGDLNGDGYTNLEAYLHLAAAGPVPEPAAASLVLVCWGALTYFSRRRGAPRR